MYKFYYNNILLFNMRIKKGLSIMSTLNCADNTGARIIQIIGVKNYRGRLGRLLRGGAGDIILVISKKGKIHMRNKIHIAVIIRQKSSQKRDSGETFYFQDNAAVLLNKKMELRGSKIYGPVSNECISR